MPDTDVLLGVGYHFVLRFTPDGPVRKAEPLILRLADGAWTTIVPEIPEGGFLLDVTFSSETTAWAWGWVGDYEGSFLIKSEDAGETWREVPSALEPSDLLTHLWFRDESAGWVVGGPLFAGVRIAQTLDGGSSWSRINNDFGFSRAGNTFGSRAGVVEVFYNGRFVQEVDPLPSAPVAIAPEDFFGTTFTTFGSTGWIGGSRETRTAIISAEYGEPWEEQIIEAAGAGSIESIDFRDPANGLACGSAARADSVSEPILCLHTDDGGASWRPAAVPRSAVTSGPIDVLWGPSDTAWLASWRVEPFVPVLLRSADGGRTWEAAEVPFPGEGLIYALARASEIRGR